MTSFLSMVTNSSSNNGILEVKNNPFTKLLSNYKR